tara:strand:- start:486 stop:1394 length:909 start_codon:yes stop_codon:yes gene_type:complete
MRWVKLYNENNLISNHNKTKKSYKITQKHINYITKILNKRNNKFLSLEELNKKLSNKFSDYNITPQWLGKVLLDNNITRKRTRKSHFPKTRYGKKISYKKEKKIFLSKINKYNINDIISIDETSIKSAMVKEYCRIIKGKRCYFKTNDNKVFRKYTLLMAISTKGVIAYKFYEKGGSNKERFLNFLQENILFKMKNKLLLFDNARSHTAKDILENIKESENDYILNVPYNPQTNPIESFFSELKHYIKLDSKIEYNDLLKSIKKSIKKIKKSHYKNHFTNSLKNNNQNRIMNNYISKKKYKQ